jgi:hypothetical protein
MTLIRKRGHDVRYYRVLVYPTLFDDFLVVHHCGKSCSRTPHKRYFNTRKEALIESLDIIFSKKAEGFELGGR